MAERSRIKKLEVMVSDVKVEAPDTVTISLFTGNDKLTYEPGNFLTIAPQQFAALERWVEYLQDLKSKKEPPRAYSLASSPDEKYIAITVKEERYTSGSTPYPPLLSPILALRTPPGTKMVVTGFTGPYKLTDEIRKQNDHIVHICAGSGIVPSFSIIKYDLRMNEGSKHTLVYSNKKREDVIFHDDFAQLECEFPDRFNVIHTLTREGDAFDYNDKIRQGRISRNLLSEAIPHPDSTAVFVCGPDHLPWQKKAAREKGEELPPSFLQSTLGFIDELGIPKERITKESYG
ncbi:MAG: oxidoreductase [Gemmatimonadetes bacterium]|nr:oxidoreductase [Gemmatimonadota bacterium]